MSEARACLGDDDLHAYLEGRLAPNDRSRVDAHCATHRPCRALLAAAVRAYFAGATVAEPTPDAPGPGSQLPVIARSSYTVEEEIARGGLGRVLRARDQRLGRTVAIKELLRVGPDYEERFIREALVTARLEHPAIVPVHEAGRWPDGEPFYAMKLVSGETLLERIQGARSLGQRLALLPSVLAVAEAAAYAHSRGVIHRDLKPANVLVGQFGETVLADWGLAKDVTAADLPGEEERDPDGGTLAGVVMGTPPYMPPEQARGEPVDERADVYSLGAILYEVLSGVAPYKDTGKRVLSAVADGPPTPVEDLEEGVPRDLLAIVRKAMARAPADRYATAGELAADLQQFLTGQVVSAREYTRTALVLRWLRRHRLPLAVAAAALAVVAVVGAVSVTRIVHARRAARAAQAVAEAARAQVEARNDRLILLTAQAVVARDPTRALAWLKAIPEAAPLWAEARSVAVEAMNRGFARHIWRAPANHAAVALSPDGRHLVATGMEAASSVHDLATGATRALDLGGRALFEAAFAADGRMFAVDDDGRVAIFTPGAVAGDGTPPRFLRPAGDPRMARTFLAVDPAGLRVATTGDNDSTVTVTDVATGATRALPGTGEGARDVGFSPDGNLVATVSIDRLLRIHDLRGGAPRDLAGAEVSSHLVFTRDGGTVLCAELSGIRAWDLATGESKVLPFPRQRTIAVAAAPDGKTVAAAGFEGPIHVLDTASGQLTTLLGHEGLVAGLEFSADGTLLASAAMDHTDRVWSLPARRDRILGRVAGTAAFPVFSPDGATVAVGDSDGAIWIFPVAGGPPRGLRAHTRPVFDVELSPDGRWLASQSKDQTVRLWDLATGGDRVLASTAPWVDFGRLAWSADGRLLAASLDLETLAVIDAASGARVCTFTGAGFNLAHAFGPDSSQIAFTANEEVRLGDLATCAARTLYRHDRNKSAYALVFAADGSLVASASDDGTVGLAELPGGRVRRLRGHSMDVSAADLAPDVRTLASGSGDREVRLWDLGTGTARVLLGHDTFVSQVRFSPDGRVLASLGLDATIRLWDTATGAGGVLLGHRERVIGLSFSPRGDLLVTGSQDGSVRLWPTDPFQGLPTAPAELRARLDELTTVRIDAGNRAISP